MAERIINLEDVEPTLFHGPGNSLLDKIAVLFPRVKIIARGNELKCVGEEADIEEFCNKVEELLAYYRKYNRLNEEDIEKYLFDSAHMKSASGGEFEQPLIYGTSGKPIRARTVNQLKLVNDYANNDLLIAEGPAGTGKTYTAIALAVKALKNQEVRKIVLTRPAVEAGERLGFLPGDMKEKLDPYLQPLYDALHDMIPSRKLEIWIDDGTVQIAPLAFMRGRTLESSVVILDEAQNATISQLKMFLTRMGVSSKFILTGDTTQIDLPKRSDSGLLQAINLLGDIEGVSVIRFDEQDIVRHRLVRHIVRAYENSENRENKENIEKNANSNRKRL